MVGRTPSVLSICSSKVWNMAVHSIADKRASTSIPKISIVRIPVGLPVIMQLPPDKKISDPNHPTGHRLKSAFASPESVMIVTLLGVFHDRLCHAGRFLSPASSMYIGALQGI
jgi:hypothetical protein